MRHAQKCKAAIIYLINSGAVVALVITTMLASIVFISIDVNNSTIRMPVIRTVSDESWNAISPFG